MGDTLNDIISVGDGKDYQDANAAAQGLHDTPFMQDTTFMPSVGETTTRDDCSTAHAHDVSRASINGNENKTCLSIDTDDETRDTQYAPEGISLSYVGALIIEQY